MGRSMLRPYEEEAKSSRINPLLRGHGQKRPVGHPAGEAKKRLRSKRTARSYAEDAENRRGRRE